MKIKEYHEEFEKINDSKKISEKTREKLFDIILENCEVGIGMATSEEIDEINILNGTFLAMRRAIEELKTKIEVIPKALIDGNHKIREYSGEQEPVIKGDGKSLAIAAASIIAKVTRDTMMKEVAKEYPEYEFEKHKGYGTKKHREILLEKGPTPIHRKSFLKKILNTI